VLFYLVNFRFKTIKRDPGLRYRLFCAAMCVFAPPDACLCHSANRTIEKRARAGHSPLLLILLLCSCHSAHCALSLYGYIVTQSPTQRKKLIESNEFKDVPIQSICRGTQFRYRIESQYIDLTFSP
jgi:hypothetical protein